MQPPQNPYNQPNAYGQPQQPFAPVPQSPRGTVSLDVIGESWKLVQANLGQWVLALLIVGVIVGIASVVIGLLQIPFMPRAGARPGGGYYLMQLVGSVLNAGVQGVATAAMFRMAITNVRTGKASLNDLFSVSDVAGSSLFAGVLVWLATLVGFLLCIIPGIIAGLGLALTQAVVADQRLQPVDAMKSSWEALKPHLGSFFVLGFVLGLINLAGAIACGVGLFVTVPIYIVSMALVYRDLFGVGSAPPQNLGYQPPPIANPNF